MRFTSIYSKSSVVAVFCLWTGLRELPYWSHYSKPRLLLHTVVCSKYFDLSIAGVIGLNVITMALEFYMMPPVSKTALGASKSPPTEQKHNFCTFDVRDRAQFVWKTQGICLLKDAMVSAQFRAYPPDRFSQVYAQRRVTFWYFMNLGL